MQPPHELVSRKRWRACWAAGQAGASLSTGIGFKLTLIPLRSILVQGGAGRLTAWDSECNKKERGGALGARSAARKREVERLGLGLQAERAIDTKAWCS